MTETTPHQTDRRAHPEVLLIAGLWLDATAWDDVLPPLAAAGVRGVPVDLPGQGAGPGAATLEDQVAAVVAAVDAASGRPVLVGHSAACSLAWMAADARPDKVGAVVLIGGFPWTDGQPYADFFEPVDGLVPFPGWEPFEGPDSADLDESARRRFEARAVPVPASVTKGLVRLRDERRFDVPVVVVCPEFSPEQARAWIDSGDVPELAAAHQVELVDLDSGHWPMFSRPAELARLLAVAGQASTGSGLSGR
ncbi:alpha/beta fold hydrolase [Nocardioides ferulae]|uniref:alpha/beta fold hydrolase n=1 Tax=Nocardioides ferulae TaxID=2340821 RepID=UPI000EADF53E|nr:alpha/beta hydrolase [Nocardioides ferulae]